MVRYAEAVSQKPTRIFEVDFETISTIQCEHFVDKSLFYHYQRNLKLERKSIGKRLIRALEDRDDSDDYFQKFLILIPTTNLYWLKEKVKENCHETCADLLSLWRTLHLRTELKNDRCFQKFGVWQYRLFALLDRSQEINFLFPHRFWAFIVTKLL